MKDGSYEAQYFHSTGGSDSKFTFTDQTGNTSSYIQVWGPPASLTAYLTNVAY